MASQETDPKALKALTTRVNSFQSIARKANGIPKQLAGEAGKVLSLVTEGDLTAAAEVAKQMGADLTHLPQSMRGMYKPGINSIQALVRNLRGGVSA